MNARREQGFTIVELVLALVLAGFVGTLIFQMLSAQGRFAQIQSSREEVQQNARAALDLVTSELRAVPRGGLIAAEANRIVAEVPVAWGLVCPGPGLRIIVPDVLPDVGTQVRLAMSESTTGVWTRSSGGVTVATASATDATTCRGTGVGGLDAQGAATVYTITNSGLDPTTQGSTAYLYREVEYEVGPSAGFPGQWLLRSWGTNTTQPIAGPLEGEGIVFRYFLGNQATPATPPGSDATALQQVTRIGVTVRSSATRESVPGRRERDEQTTLVHLRNSILLN